MNIKYLLLSLVLSALIFGIIFYFNVPASVAAILYPCYVIAIYKILILGDVIKSENDDKIL